MLNELSTSGVNSPDVKEGSGFAFSINCLQLRVSLSRFIGFVNPLRLKILWNSPFRFVNVVKLKYGEANDQHCFSTFDQ